MHVEFNCKTAYSTTKEEGIEMFVLSVHTYIAVTRKNCARVYNPLTLTIFVEIFSILSL